MLKELTLSAGVDTLWFSGWLPTSRGATAGAALGLFALAVLHRFLAASRLLLEQSWRLQDVAVVPANATSAPMLSRDSQSSADTASADEKDRSLGFPPTSAAVLPVNATMRLKPNFILGREMMRGLLAMLGTGIGYFLMLAVRLSPCVTTASESDIASRS